MIMAFFELSFLFMIGSAAGWLTELFFRRIFSAKRWINPGFLNGPYLPMYGFGTCILFGFSSIPLAKGWIVLIVFFALTLLEYLTGLIFIKGMKIKLWDYSDRFGNIQGIICPLFSLLWGAIGAAFVFLLYEPLSAAAAWAAGNPYMLFFTGIFYGVLAVDVCISFNVSLKVRRGAVRFKEVVHYEQLKASIAERRRRLKMKANFLFPLKSDRPLKESVEELLEKLRGRKNK